MLNLLSRLGRVGHFPYRTSRQIAFVFHSSGSTLLAFTLLILGTACETTETPTPPPPLSVVQAPIPELDPSFQTFELAAERGAQWQLPTGTRSTIPAHAVVDAQDSLVSGPVQLRYREFHDAYDIYLSGIPMRVGDRHFSTAGSFHLLAEQNAQALRVAPDTKIEVRMASFTAGEEYDFFQLDEYSGAWTNLGTAAPEVNVEREKQVRKIRRMQPRLRFPLNRRYLAFNYRAILDVYFDRRRASPEEMDGVPARLKDYGLGWTEAEVHQRISWREQEYHASLMVWRNESGKAFPDWTAKRYGRLEALGRDRYRYHVASADSSQLFEVKLKAIMPLQALFAFPPEHWIEDYQATMAKVEAEQERLRTMAEVYRTFEVAEMGIFNWDYFLKTDEQVLISGQFSFEKHLPDSLAELELVFLSGDERAVVVFPQDRWSEIALAPDRGGRLFCLLPGKRLAVYSPEQYGAINFDDLRGQVAEVKDFYFDMPQAERIVQSKEDLMELLAGAP